MKKNKYKIKHKIKKILVHKYFLTPLFCYIIILVSHGGIKNMSFLINHYVENKNKVIIKTSVGNLELDIFNEKDNPMAGFFLNNMNNNIYKKSLFIRSVKNYIIQVEPMMKNRILKSAINRSKSVSRNKIQYTHKRGVVAMAESKDGYLDGSFFILLDDYSNLDGKYEIVGYVKSGIDNLEKIQPGDIKKNGIIFETKDSIYDIDFKVKKPWFLYGGI